VRSKLIFLFVVVVSVVGIMLAGCAKAPTPAAPTPGTPTAEVPTLIPFGTVSCLSGPYAPWGLSESRCQQLEVNDINAGGPLWGTVYGHEPGFRVQGKLYNWKLIPYDYKMDPTEGTRVVNRLIYDDKVTFMHIFCWPGLYPNREVLTENKIFVSEQGMGTDIVGPQYPTTFMFLQQPYQNGAVIPSYMHDKLGYKTVAIIGDDSPDGVVYSSEYEKGFNKAGIKVVSKQIYQPGTTDYTPLLTKAAALNPDVIAALKVDAPSQGMFVKQARQAGYKGDIFQGAPFTWKELVETSGSMENLEGLMSTMMIGEECPLPQQKWLRDTYTKAYGAEEYDGSIVDRADPIPMITLAIEKANSFDTAAVSKALEAMESPEIKSFYGDPCWFGGQKVFGINHCLITPTSLVRVTNGHPVTLEILIPPRDAY
jgi:branched-chain amino acid transport system substrate-binding protein